MLAHDPVRSLTLQRVKGGFTLMEMMVSIGVLALLMIMISQIFGAALAVTGVRNMQMDADAQARAVFDRMAIDFAQMVKRPDVDYFLKSSFPDQYGNPAQPQTGNDQIAFYSQVPGYYLTTNGISQNRASLVGYRVNTNSSSPYYSQLQRFGAGLIWNGVASGSFAQMVFSSGTNGPTSTSGTNNAIFNNWPNATNMIDDPNYEPMGPQVFRMEYYYILKGQTSSAGTVFTSQASDTPWETRIDTQGTGLAYHNSVNGLQDVAAITAIIAVADPKSRILVKPDQLTNLAGAMKDFGAVDSNVIGDPSAPGYLEAGWQSEINSPTNGIPRVASSSLRVYRRTFYLPSNLPFTP